LDQCTAQIAGRSYRLCYTRSCEVVHLTNTWSSVSAIHESLLRYCTRINIMCLTSNTIVDLTEFDIRLYDCSQSLLLMQRGYLSQVASYPETRSERNSNKSPVSNQGILYRGRIFLWCGVEIVGGGHKRRAGKLDRVIWGENMNIERDDTTCEILNICHSMATSQRLVVRVDL
jgi:hypothetical protein